MSKRVTKVTTAKKKTKSAPKLAKPAKAGGSPSRHIDARIKELGDWRGETLARVRAIIKQAAPDVVEEWKWRGVPVWEHDGIICTGETYKAVVKLTFAKGASLDDPSHLFNASLEGNMRRAIDIHDGDKIDAQGVEDTRSRRRGIELGQARQEEIERWRRSKSIRKKFARSRTQRAFTLGLANTMTKPTKSGSRFTKWVPGSSRSRRRRP